MWKGEAILVLYLEAAKECLVNPVSLLIEVIVAVLSVVPVCIYFSSTAFVK